MNHAITIRDIIAILAGLVVLALAIEHFAPEKLCTPLGCIVTIIGTALIALSVGLLV